MAIHAQSVACWLFSTNNPAACWDIELSDSKKAAVEFLSLRNDSLYVLAMQKNSKQYRKIAPVMRQAFDFSEFLLNPIGLEFPSHREEELAEHTAKKVTVND